MWGLASGRLASPGKRVTEFVRWGVAELLRHFSGVTRLPHVANETYYPKVSKPSVANGNSGSNSVTRQLNDSVTLKAEVLSRVHYFSFVPKLKV